MKILLVSIAVIVGLAAQAPAYAQSGRDARWGLAGIFPRERLFCGQNRWDYDGLIWGKRRVGVCILKTNRENVFGGPFGF